MNQPLRSTLAAMLLRSGKGLRTAVGAAAALGAAGAAHAAELNVVRSLDVSKSGVDTVVAIGGSKAPVFTVFRLESPPRVVVDLSAADLSAVQGTVGGQGSVKQVAASQFSDGKASVARVVIGLADGASYDVKAQGQQVVVRVSEAHAQAEPAAPAAPAGVKAPAAESKAEAQAQAEPAAPSDPHLVVQRLDEKEVASPATRVTGAKLSRHGKQTRLEVLTDGEVGTYQLTELREPARLALDLRGVKGAAKLHVSPEGPVRDVRAGKQPDGLRIVVDADELPQGSYKVERTSKGLAVVFGQARAEAPVQVAEVKATPPAPVEAKPEPKAESRGDAAQASAVKVKDVSFKGDDAKADLAIALGGTTRYEVTRPDPHTAVLTLHAVDLPRELERTLDTSAFGGPVKTVSTFAQGSGDIQVVATLDSEVQDEVKAGPKGLRWSFKASADTEMAIDGVKIELGDSRALGLQAEAPAYAQSGAPRKPKYTGRRVSFEFKDIDIHNLLRIIAEVSKKNIIVSDDVSGKITIRLRNVPWDQALDIILKTKGLDKDEQGNIVRVLHADKLAAEREAAAKLRKEREDSEEPKLRLIPVNYAEAQELADRVKELLSKKGTVTVDKRTNVLIVKDVVASLSKVEGLVRSLDLQTPQVLIEARIVEANTNFSNELGVQWGGQVAFAPSLGNATGLAFPSIAVASGASDANTAPGLTASPNFAVDLPAAVGSGKGGGLGFIFGSAGGAASLNLRISAAESTGSAKTISAPKVTTLDNDTATISQGIAIPFSQFSAAGVNTAFIEAKLELKVTPHVTSDRNVVLKIDATNNQPNPGFTGANGQPAISKKEAHTHVLVKDGDTTVIGGIYTRQTSNTEDIVPIFGKIPVLGWFFRHRDETDTRTELLIFVTPHIVNSAQSVVAAGGNTPPPSANP